jgi:hypothetical protein
MEKTQKRELKNNIEENIVEYFLKARTRKDENGMIIIRTAAEEYDEVVGVLRDIKNIYRLKAKMLNDSDEKREKTIRTIRNKYY